jgi:tRNA U34 5-methylaminomethyl-2-thiouridine-forming methyltransferase MnmC
MEVKLVVTGDGSHTLLQPRLNEHYHSTFGAIQESRHIFISSGLGRFQDNSEVAILEVGFGTGLNALLTILEADQRNLKVDYTAIEPQPIDAPVFLQLNYPYKLGLQASLGPFKAIHEAPFLKKTGITKGFSLVKMKGKLEIIKFSPTAFDLVYFDAFSPEVQPELWTDKIFRKLFNALKPGGILVTYSAKGSVTRALKLAGFRIEKLPGPPGKREITRALKTQ